jgi:hypothetical protein
VQSIIFIVVQKLDKPVNSHVSCKYYSCGQLSFGRNRAVVNSKYTDLLDLESRKVYRGESGSNSRPSIHMLHISMGNVRFFIDEL